MNFSPEGNRNHAACLAILERMSPDELTPGKPPRYEALDEATDHGRFERRPRKLQPVFERDFEAASKLREWAE
jgi:hypothetical protein